MEFYFDKITINYNENFPNSQVRLSTNEKFLNLVMNLSAFR